MTFEELKQNLTNDEETYIDILGKTHIHVNKILSAEKYFKKINSDITEQELQDTLGRKYKAALSTATQLLAFLSKQNRKRPTMISCYLFGGYGKDGTPQKIVYKTERAIKYLIKLNIIKCIQDFYSPDGGVAQVYQVYWMRYDSLISLIREKAMIWEIYNVYCKEECNRNMNKYVYNDDKEEDNVDDMSIRENNVVNKLVEKLQDLIKIQNSLQSDKMFKYRLEEGKGRPYANICSTPSEKHTHAEYPVLRSDILSKYFREKAMIWEIYNNNKDNKSNKYYYEYDRSNSIYKLNMYVREYKVLPNSREECDLYTYLLDGKEIEGGRDLMKLLTMSLYFSDARKFRSLVEHFCDYYILHNARSRIIAQKGRSRVWAVIQLLGLNKGGSEIPSCDELVSLCTQWYKDTREKLKSFTGEFVGKDIFIYEGIVNIYTEIQIRQAGFECVSVYDGFYTNCEETFWWDCYQKSLYYLRSLIESIGE